MALRSILTFGRDDSGAANEFSILMLLGMLAIGAYGVDYSSATSARTQLQITADTAAHAALLTRELHPQADAIKAALDVAAYEMPASKYGNVLRAEDVVFGTWDADAGTFRPDPNAKSGVRVVTRMNATRGNALQTYLYRLVGQDEWDINVASTFETYHPTCLREGFVAEGVVDLQSNNSYSDGFCIHSNQYVSLNSNNYFEPGTVVSMSDLSLLDLPNSGFKTNVGLQQALREGSWFIRILKRLPTMISGLRNGNAEYTPDYITNIVPVMMKNRTVYQADIKPGRIHILKCTGGAAATIKNDVVVSRAVLIADCQIKFEANVRLEDVVVATTSTSAKSISASSGFTVGKNDNCAAGGGAQIITMGSMDFPADLRLYNAQLIAAQNISFSANANGIKGAALVAGGEISGTSNMSMGTCGTGMEDNFHAKYFRLVD